MAKKEDSRTSKAVDSKTTDSKANVKNAETPVQEGRTNPWSVIHGDAVQKDQFRDEDRNEDADTVREVERGEVIAENQKAEEEAQKEQEKNG